MEKLTACKCFSVVMAVVLILGIAAIAIPASPVGAQEGTWDIQVVDNANVFSTSIALDSHGNPHIAYTAGGLDSLYYASWTGTAWVTELVDDVPASVTSLALDSKDGPHICYTTLGGQSLHYARWTGSSWSKEIVDTASVTDCSLALDSRDIPHVCYIAPGVAGHELQYAWLTNAGWDHSLSTFDPDSGYPNSCSLALDNLDRPHVGFATSGGPFTVHYYHLVGGSWDDEVVYEGPATSVSIALDSHGGPHIAYATGGLLSLHYASRAGGSWTTQTVDPTNASDCSLAMDSNDRPHISYFVGGGILSAPIAPPAGEEEPVDQGIDGGLTLTGTLKYAELTDSTWDIETVDQETLHITGATGPYYGSKWCSLALDADDLPHISYGNLLLGFTDSSCRYAHLVMPVMPEPPANPQYSPPMPNINRYLNQANMSVQYISVNPQQALASQPVTITTNVVNTGDAAGNYNVDLKINGQVEESRMISVGPQASQPVKFTVTRDQPGTYTVDIVDKSGSFTILGDSTAGGTSGQPGIGIIILALIGALIVVAVVVLLLRRA